MTANIHDKEVASDTTRFVSIASYEKGCVEILNDDPRHYAFSNVFEVASNAAPYEKTAVGKNMDYVVEAIRAEGTSQWRTAAHDEFALVLDAHVEISLVKLAHSPLAPDAGGSVALDGEPEGQPRGPIAPRRGHMAPPPAGGAYRVRAQH